MDFIADQEERLDKFLARMLPEFSRTKLTVMINDEEVWVDGHNRKPSFKLEPGMAVNLGDVEPTPLHDLTPMELDLDVVYEDDSLLVLNKARGVATHPAPGLHEATLVNALLARSMTLSTGTAEFRPGIVHRLDKETTGLMVIAKNDTSHMRLSAQIAEKTAERRYVGLAQGRLEHPRLKVEAPIGRDPKDRRRMTVDQRGKDAVTHVKLLAEVEGNTLFAARLETGRTHQIRVHLLATGHALRGDTIYAKFPWGDGPLQLHAAYLAFAHPERDEAMAFYMPPPPDFHHGDLVKETDLTEW